jgi:hypothetical protein
MIIIIRIIRSDLKVMIILMVILINQAKCIIPGADFLSWMHRFYFYYYNYYFYYTFLFICLLQNQSTNIFVYLNVM